MISKRSARVFAMQSLYAKEVSERSLVQVLSGVLDANPIKDDQRAFGMKLLDLYQEHHDDLKAELESLTNHWSVERLAMLDRLIIMLGMTEMRFVSETPVVVVMSECTEIAKKYSTADSASFVNGVLKGFAQKHKLLD